MPQITNLINSKVMNTDVNLYVERDALLRQLLEVDDISVIKKVQNALKRALSTVKETAAPKEEEVEYITKEEQEEMLLDAFTEMFRARKEGIKRKTLQEVIDEL